MLLITLLIEIFISDEGSEMVEISNCEEIRFLENLDWTEFSFYAQRFCIEHINKLLQ